MSTACKTTNTPNVVVCSEEKGVELMGMDLPQTDPYMVESEMEDDGLFGDAATANNRQAVSAPDGGDASDTADSPDAETAEALQKITAKVRTCLLMRHYFKRT